MKRDIYQEVTDRIIASLEAGTVPWQRPWRTVGGGLPTNVRTGTKYRGINVFLLGIESLIEGYTDPRWGTYKAIGEAGGQIRKGEKGTQIVFWKKVQPSKAKLAEDPDAKPFFMLRYYTVFNVEQADGIEPLPTVPLPEHDRNEQAETILTGYFSPNTRKLGKGEFVAGPEDREGGNSAFYEIDKDRVTRPRLGQFDDADAYYATTFHEAVHSTGHEKRLKRIEPAIFGSDPYAKEELVAEIGASMLCAVADIDSRIESAASYIDHWLGRFKGDPKLVVQAAAQAQKAADMILGTTFDTDDTGKPATTAGDLALSA